MITFMIVLFVVGYLAIALEHVIKINKAVSAILAGVLCWTVYVLMSPKEGMHHISEQLVEHLGANAGILFFLLGAMTIVELINAHNGFDVITKVINFTSKRKLLWIMSIITFFLSAVLDNLTTTIVMISLLSKFSLNKEDKMFFAGITVIAANAGGAWTPIGDVTTTMLWIGNRITSVGVMKSLLFPSLISLIVPLITVSFFIKGKIDPIECTSNGCNPDAWERNSVFFLGIGALLFVPFFKSITHLPPFMGILLGLGVLWLYTEIIHAEKHDEARELYSVTTALRRIDMGSVLFFLGILTCIAALESSGILGATATALNQSLKNPLLIDFVIGVLSAIVDNVPLVAGTMGMYTLNNFAVDNQFWLFLSYCAGTGGSILVIGSAAGVVSMALAKINFMWYMKKISLVALIGYIAGAGAFLLQEMLMK
ncbi:MAG TPA: sodium:proton antiporter NhaD [Chitinispirillaceae bacterium]|nr:sodium:proton antiporter NhaD [Chitinispirillaceae bacterium]